MCQNVLMQDKGVPPALSLFFLFINYQYYLLQLLVSLFTIGGYEIWKKTNVQLKDCFVIVPINTI